MSLLHQSPWSALRPWLDLGFCPTWGKGLLGGWRVLRGCRWAGVSSQTPRHVWGWPSSQGLLVAGASSPLTCSCRERSPWCSWGGGWGAHGGLLVLHSPCCTVAKAPTRARVRLPQWWGLVESWGPAQQRGGRTISLFLLLLPLSHSSGFTESYDLWPNPAREGTQLPWAPPLGPLVVLPAGPEPNRLHKGAAGGRSLLARILRCSVECCSARTRPQTLSVSLVLHFPL